MDGNARVKRNIGAIVTTFGVGELSALNGIGESFYREAHCSVSILKVFILCLSFLFKQLDAIPSVSLFCIWSAYPASASRRDMHSYSELHDDTLDLSFVLTYISLRQSHPRRW